MKNKRKVLYWSLVILWMGIIFYLSHQPATESNDLSKGITEKIINIIEILTKDLEVDISGFNHIIRKMSHFGAYFILGVLVVKAIGQNKPLNIKLFIASVTICILYAISDEIHQSFIPGRGPSAMDVLIDSAGSWSGILISNFIIRVKGKIIIK